VLPEPFVRVPEEQIHSPIARRRQLFADGRLQIGRAIRDACADLDHPEELRELGTALFLDRPLGGAKAPGEPDQTLLMSHVLFSRSLAQQRLRRLARRAEFLADPDAVKRWQERLRTLPADGLRLAAAGPAPRPGVVSLHDALRVADDFLLLRTTRQTLRDFQGHYGTEPLVERLGEIIPPVDQWRLLIPGGTVAEPLLQAYDRHLRLRLELAPDLSHGYATRGGVEFPAAGLRVLRAWGMGGEGIAEPLNLRRERLTLLPRR
jgi:hypothetical protein